MYKFRASKNSDLGITRQKTRVETASLIVASDGTGDFGNIQEAINSLKGPGKIMIKEGTYRIKTGLSISTQGVEIEGTGYNTLIESTEEIDILSITEKDTVVKNIRFKGTDSGTKKAVVITQTENVKVEGCTFENIYYAIYNAGTWNAIFSKNIVAEANWTTKGIVLTNNGGTNSENCIIEGNNFSCEDTNFELLSAEDCIVIGNNCLGAGDKAVEINAGTHNIVSSNVMPLSSNIGIYLTNNTTKNIIIGNMVNDAFTSGITIDAGSNNNTVTSNIATISDAGTGTISANNQNP